MQSLKCIKADISNTVKEIRIHSLVQCKLSRKQYGDNRVKASEIVHVRRKYGIHVECVSFVLTRDITLQQLW